MLIILVIAGWYLFNQSFQPKYALPLTNTPAIQIERLLDTPIVHIGMSRQLQEEAKKYGYTNINGPSLIKVPNWVKQPLGKYYLYFAHHKGEYIRLAYADSLMGNWTIYDEEIMPLAKSGFITATDTIKTDFQMIKKYMSLSEIMAFMEIGKQAQKAAEKRTKDGLKTSASTKPHVASPDIIVDEENQQIRLYYHGVVEGKIQMSKVATSIDGLTFEPKPQIIGVPYLRMFQHQNQYYGLGMPGFFHRSQDGLKDFEIRKRWLFGVEVRHCAVYKREDQLVVFYTRVGDAPEQILVSFVDISSIDWNDWKATPPQEVMKPELVWEGSKEEIVPSIRGEMGILVNQLRDPAIFEEDGQLYLLYTGGGEQAIGIAKIDFDFNKTLGLRMKVFR